jgi:hypothetical protein
MWSFVGFRRPARLRAKIALTESGKDGSTFPMQTITKSNRMSGDGAEIPPGGRELAVYVKDMLSSLRRCAGAPYFENLRALLLMAEEEAAQLARQRKDTERRWRA